MIKITKNIIKILIVACLMVTINLIFIQNIAFASFADYDDATADAQAVNDLKEQQEEDAKNAGKSSNNYLKELSVNGYEISPTFDKQTINYSIDSEVTEKSIIINAKADDDRASVSGIGEVELQSGENNLRIDVMAENGVARTYFIKVTKKIEEENLKLKELKLSAVTSNGNEEIEISPEFNKDIFKYECTVYNDITEINIETLSDVKNANIEITGNKNLQIGNNVITITVTSEDGLDQTIYKIDAIRRESTVSTYNEARNINTNVVITIVIVLIILIILIILIKHSKKNNKKILNINLNIEKMR